MISDDVKDEFGAGTDVRIAKSESGMSYVEYRGAHLAYFKTPEEAVIYAEGFAKGITLGRTDR